MRKRSSTPIPTAAVPLRSTMTIPAAIALAAVLFVGPSAIGLERDRLQRDLLAALEASDWETLDGILPRAMQAHPSEPVFALIAGHASLVRDRPDTLSWLNRAMMLAPLWYEPHNLAARWLARRGAVEQAWLEVREVRTRAPERAYTAACYVASRPTATRPAMRIFEDDPRLLDEIAECPDLAPPDREILDRALALRGVPSALLRRANAELAAGRIEEAIQTAEQIRSDGTSDLAVGLAGFYSSVDRPADACRILREQIDATSEPTGALYESLARAQARVGDAEGMRATIHDWASLESTVHTLASTRLVLADLELMLGNQSRSLSALEEAYGFDPEGPALERIVGLAERLGDVRRGFAARRELCRRRGPTSEWCTTPEASVERADLPAQLPYGSSHAP